MLDLLSLKLAPRPMPAHRGWTGDTFMLGPGALAVESHDHRDEKGRDDRE